MDSTPRPRATEDWMSEHDLSEVARAGDMKLGDLLPSQIGRRHRQRGPASSGDPAVSSILSLPAVSLPNRPALSLSKGSKSSSAADVLSPEPAEGSRAFPSARSATISRDTAETAFATVLSLSGFQMPAEWHRAKSARETPCSQVAEQRSHPTRTPQGPRATTDRSIPQAAGPD